jgi:probable phosphoglycerate mutase
VTIPATELLIARHGEAHCNREQLIGGPRGCRGLTNQGRRQIERLAQHLSQQQHERPIHGLYTTPLQRARESAAIIGAFLGLDPEIDADLAEQDHGTADGRPWVEVVSEYGDIPALDADRPLAPGGESWRQYLNRSSIALGRIIARHDGQRIFIVGHGETVDTTFKYFFGITPETRQTAIVAAHYASLTIWSQQPLSWTRPHAGERWVLTSHNDTHHLVVNPVPSRE